MTATTGIDACRSARGAGPVPGGTSTDIAIGPVVPLLLIAAQDRLPQSQAAASGVVLGFANGIAGIAFAAIASTHGIVGLSGGALVAIAGLVPAAALIRGGPRRAPHTPRPLCHITPCGCAVAALEMARS